MSNLADPRRGSWLVLPPVVAHRRASGYPGTTWMSDRSTTTKRGPIDAQLSICLPRHREPVPACVFSVLCSWSQRHRPV